MTPLGVLRLGTVPYAEAWELQRRLAAARRAGEIEDCLVLLEHPPVYTVGRNGAAEHLGAGPDALRASGAEFVEVDRGGSVTFHGPGQLVGYPIIDLAAAFPIPGHEHHGDVLRYLRALEAGLIDAVAGLGVAAQRRPPHTGIWVEPAAGRWEKLAAIGVKLATGVTTHGIALNVTTDLGWFARITPCGIVDGGVTSLAALGISAVGVDDVAPRVGTALAAALGREARPASAAIRALVARVEVAVGPR